MSTAPSEQMAPRLLLSAASSDAGKTTITVGLMAALVDRGLTVAPAKVGPDFIDPGYHALATGRPGRNLDPWLCTEELIVPLLLHGARTPSPADLTIIEGVMGLFDGRLNTDGFGSTAHVARLTQSPVVLVIDIARTSRTAAAVAHGLATMETGIDVAGVILNRAGSQRHSDEVRRAMDAVGLRVLGVVPRDPGIAAPSRHLGLVPARERDDAAAGLDRLAGHISAHVDLDAVVDVANAAAPLDGVPWEPEDALGWRPSPGPAPVVAIAGGRAFTFRYAEVDELLRAAGCEPVVFDPMADTALPDGTAGVYLGGGFPEVHARDLSQNTPLRELLRSAIGAGLPTVAECAGLLYLCHSLDNLPMVGAVPARAEMTPRLRLDYLVAEAANDTLLAEAGQRVTGHEFHRTRVDPSVLGPAWVSGGVEEGFSLDPAGRGSPSLHASYLHTHWAGYPALARRFAEAVHVFAGLGTPLAAVPGVARAPDRAALTHHGDVELAPGLADFAVNVRLPAPPAWLRDLLVAELASVGRYPDAAPARAAIAAHHGVDPSMVLPTSGGAEAFSLVARGIAGRRPMVVHPQFTEPDVALSAAGRQVDHLILSAERGFVLDREPANHHDLVLVGNPTNPTGVLHPADALLGLCRPGRVVVVDEAFMDAVPGEPESLIGPEMAGLLVIRSLTKTWALAGLRAGYVVGDPALVTTLAENQPAWSVGSLAVAAMQACLSERAIAEQRAAATQFAAHRSHLTAGLGRLGLEPVDSAAPFVLVRTPAPWWEALRAAGFAVRRGDSFPGLDAHWLRIAVRAPERSDAILKALERLVNES